jgi:hypothetical protein
VIALVMSTPANCACIQLKSASQLAITVLVLAGSTTPRPAQGFVVVECIVGGDAAAGQTRGDAHWAYRSRLIITTARVNWDNLRLPRP